jgi:hypothetical protein
MILSVRTGNRSVAILECRHATIDDFSGSSASRLASLRDSLLRANRAPTSGRANERAETLRHDGPLPAGHRPMRTSTWFYPGRNPAALLRFPQHHQGFGTVADAFPKETHGTRPIDGRDKNRAAITEKDDAKLPLRHPGSMWQENIPARLRRRRDEISAGEASNGSNCLMNTLQPLACALTFVVIE